MPNKSKKEKAPKIRDLTLKQISELPWGEHAPSVKFALINKETLQMPFCSDTRAWLEGNLRQIEYIDPRHPEKVHPLKGKMQIVERP